MRVDLQMIMINVVSILQPIQLVQKHVVIGLVIHILFAEVVVVVTMPVRT